MCIIENLSRHIIDIILMVRRMYLIRGLMVTPKENVVRANFTVLQSDLELITQIKKRCLLLGIDTNKSELIRAGIDALSKLSDNKLRDTLAQLPKPKVGGKRPSLNSPGSDPAIKSKG
jgi:hypothetical protein